MYFYFTAFQSLSTCRSGMEEIPWTAIDTYCKRFDVTGEDYDVFEYFMMQMDHAYLKHLEKKSKAKQ